MQEFDTIKKLAKERGAVILAHNYQRAEVQDVADFVGDSLELSIRARDAKEDVIVFCGVHFMAETAKILSPDKIVLIPREDAGCPMADMVTPEMLEEMRKLHPKKSVVTYVNSSATVKAFSDVCCTSSNAVDVVNAISNDEILFVPDKNLADFVRRHTVKKILAWEGYCPTHERLTADDAKIAILEHPDAVFLVHPECRPEVCEMAEAALSTAGIIRYCRESVRTEFLIGTEEGILHRLKAENPDKKFHLASKKLICPNMKLTKLCDIQRALETMSPVVEVSPGISARAKKALDEMYRLTAR